MQEGQKHVVFSFVVTTCFKNGVAFIGSKVWQSVDEIVFVAADDGYWSCVSCVCHDVAVKCAISDFDLARVTAFMKYIFALVIADDAWFIDK